MLDLRRVARACQVQGVAHEPVGELHPVDLGICGVVGIEVTRGPAELRGCGNVAQHLYLFLEPFDIDHHLLAEAGWRGGLSVGARQQRHVLPLARHQVQFVQQLADQRIVDPVGRLADRVWRGGVVDVLRGEPEVYELAVVMQPEFVHLLLYEVLHRLDVVVCGALDLFDTQGVLDLEVLVDRPQIGEVLLFDVGELGQGYSAQSDEILNLDQHAVTNQRVFREIVVQRHRSISVPAVYRRDRRYFC